MLALQLRKLALGLLLLPLSMGLSAASFVIQDIRLDGLQRISPGTVFNYLPVAIGGAQLPPLGLRGTG